MSWVGLDGTGRWEDGCWGPAVDAVDLATDAMLFCGDVGENAEVMRGGGVRIGDEARRVAKGGDVDAAAP